MNNIIEKLSADYSSNRLYNSYIIETNNVYDAFLQVIEFLSNSFLASVIDKDVLNEARRELTKNENKLDFAKFANIPDLFLVKKEDSKAKDISIEQVHLLQKFINNTSVISGFKIGIILNAELMNVKAENACLKMLEDTPSRTLLILVTNNLASILPTIKSRCTKIVSGKNERLEDDLPDEYLNIFSNNFVPQDRIDFIQSFLSKDRAKWLIFADNIQKMLVKFIKILSSNIDDDNRFFSKTSENYEFALESSERYIDEKFLSDREEKIFVNLAKAGVVSLKNKYDKIEKLIFDTKQLDLDLRASTLSIIQTLSD